MNSGRGQILRGSFNRSVNDRKPSDESDLVLDFRFAEDARMYEKIDFSRDSNATQTGSDGYIKYAPNNVLTSSEDIVNDWTLRGSVSVTAGQSDPDGGTTAYLFDGVIGAGLGDVYQSITGLPANAPYVVSFYIKKVTSTGTLYINNPQTAGAGQWSVDLSKIGTGWERITESHAAVTVMSSHKVYTNGGGGIHIYSGGDLDFYFWHPQIEMSFSSSDAANDYISTGSGSAVFKERFDHVPETGEKRGLLIEEARTNLLVQSQDFTTSWTKTNVNTPTIASNIIDPSGGYGSYKLTEDTADYFHFIYLSPTIGASAHTLSCYMKAGERTTASLMLTQAGNVGAIFNLETGQVDSVTGTGNTAQIVDTGNGWYRCSITNDGSSDIGDFARIGVQNGALGSYQGDGVSGIYIFGAQLEANSFVSSLIPSFGNSSTRAADVVEVTGTNFSRFFKDTEGTFVVDAQVPKGYNYTDYFGSLFQDPNGHKQLISSKNFSINEHGEICLLYTSEAADE